MSLKKYRKLEFGSMEKLDDETSSNSTTDGESGQPPTTPPNTTPDDQSTPPTTTTAANGTTITTTTPPPSFPQRGPAPNPCPTDKSMVVTRDYYGLAETVGGNHSCLILFTNGSTSADLRDPAIFAKKGYTRIPPDSRIKPNCSAYCAFRKPSIAVRGTSGVISYEYHRSNGRSKRFAVMWKIPYRVVNREENQVALKWLDVDLSDLIDASTHTGMELYREMTKSDKISREVAKNGKSLHILNSEDEAEISATFSGSCKAIVKVDFFFK